MYEKFNNSDLRPSMPALTEDVRAAEAEAILAKQFATLDNCNLNELVAMFQECIVIYAESLSEIHAALCHIVPMPQIRLGMEEPIPVDPKLPPNSFYSTMRTNIETFRFLNESLMIVRKSVISITRK